MNRTSLAHRALLLAATLALASGVCANSQAEAPPDPLARTLDAMLTGLYAKDAPGAAVIAVRDGRTVLRKAYGMADLELGVPLQPDMVLRIGSMTKQFTAVAILMLVEEGKVRFSDPITKFLPDYPTGGKTITVEHLLTHTSGIKSYTDMDDFFANMRKDYTVKELIDHFKNQPMEFEPGEKYQYDNSGYFLLGAIVEKASGMGYEAFLKKRIFDVVGMARTSVESTSRIIPGRARGYSRTGDTWTNADWLSMTQPYSAGALVSTVDDLAKWDAALLDRLRFERDAGGKVAGLVRQGFGSAPDRCPRTADAPVERKEVRLPPGQLDRCVGRYELVPGFVLEVTREGDRLFSQATGQPKVEIFAESEKEFFLKVVDAQLTFQLEGTGPAKGLTLHQGGHDHAARRLESP